MEVERSMDDASPVKRAVSDQEKYGSINIGWKIVTERPASVKLVDPSPPLTDSAMSVNRTAPGGLNGTDWT